MRKLETLDRALLLLQQFEPAAEEFTVTALAARLGVHHSSVSRMVGTLLERDFLARGTRNGTVRLGPQLRRLGLLALAPHNAIAEARVVMQDLVGRVEETVVLSVLDGDHTIDVAQVDAAHLVAAQQWIGRRSPVHASSGGKVFLAFGGPDLASLTLTPITARTITDVERLSTEVEDIRTRGWSGSIGEFERGLNGVAAPVCDAHGVCVYTLNVSGPEYRLTPERLAEVAEATRVAARGISIQLGFVSPLTS